MNTIPALIQKANDSLHAARLLASQGFFDFAVGRAYFTMHYVAEAFLLTQKLDASDPRAVVDAFGQRFAQPLALPPIFHRYLVEAARIREAGEYATTTGITAETVAEQIERAMAFLALAKEELSDVSR